MTATVSGAFTDALQGTPEIRRYLAAIDGYEFEMFTSFRTGRSQFITIWGEGPRPREGTYLLTPWREGKAGTRMHAMYGADVAGGAAWYQAVGGELRITTSSSDGIEGEFSFHGVAGYLLPDAAVLSPEDAPVEVQGLFAARCIGQEVCR
jgi:hypothetical protein